RAPVTGWLPEITAAQKPAGSVMPPLSASQTGTAPLDCARAAAQPPMMPQTMTDARRTRLMEAPLTVRVNNRSSTGNCSAGIAGGPLDGLFGAPSRPFVNGYVLLGADQAAENLLG